MAQDASVNSDAPSLMDVIRGRVARTQIKYHRWAKTERMSQVSWNLGGDPVWTLCGGSDSFGL
jgi:hypothetical protein